MLVNTPDLQTARTLLIPKIAAKTKESLHVSKGLLTRPLLRRKLETAHLVNSFKPLPALNAVSPLINRHVPPRSYPRAAALLQGSP